MVTPPFRLAPHAFDDDASNPALPHFNAAVARRMGEIAVNLA
ncbi:heme-degrading domain-containing protein, partial [Burkholderia sp. KCJ3K979]|nr:heme-degrading domain-containing protein [Burkholderia sp. KCJ3K979]